MSQPIFNQVVLDPTLIKGVYDTCDQWCMYCPVTERCLVYRCSPDIQSGKQNIYEALADRLYEGMTFVKKTSDAEGTPRPELDALLSNDPRKCTTLEPVGDPLERVSRRYGHLCVAYLSSRGDYPFEMRGRTSGPTPFEVFAWFHRLIPAKLYRALLCSSAIARGDQSRKVEQQASAKVALLGIDRSLEALASMTADDEDPRLELISAQLRRVKREAEARFPKARGFYRQGLD
jgi:hypothetical protein